jgi:hypothetical protein
MSRRIALFVVAAVAVLVLPSASLAKPASGGGGGGDSSRCQTLKDRKDLYNGIANDKSQPSKVREFYGAKARGAAAQGLQEGCSWTKPPAAKRTGGNGTTTSPAATLTFIKNNPNGSQQHNEYCRGVADLINEAEREGDAALLRGDEQGANEWYALADEFLERATRNGCRFTYLKHRVGGVQQPLTLALSPR